MNQKNADIQDLLAQTRLISIDVFRGLTIATMIFVNLLSERSFRIEGIPKWMRHAFPPKTMTFVDVVFPAFLFIVGLCIPIALTRRLEKTKSIIQLWPHILIRTASLMIMGILMANLWYALDYAHPVGISISLWGVLLFVSFFLIWNKYPKSQGLKRAIFTALRIGGAVLLVYLVAVFRKGPDSSWLEFGKWGYWSWWVLGIIGWCYLISSAIYIMFRKHIAGVMGALALLILMYIGDVTGVFNNFSFLNGIRRCVPFGPMLGTWPSISTAGLIVGMLYTNASSNYRPAKKTLWILVFAVGLFIAGWLLRPLFGISSGEGRATPTWALYSSAISCLIFVFCYWLFDIKQKKQWVNFILPAAQNPLSTYLFSRMIYPLFGLLQINYINNYYNSGIPGIIRIILYTAIIMFLSGLLAARCRITLRL